MILKSKEGSFEKWMVFTGFVSTSLDKAQAKKFACSNKKSGHEATIFEILWHQHNKYYLMDLSAFPDEKEVILYDRSKFEVVSIDQIQYQGKPLNVIVLKCEDSASDI